MFYKRIDKLISNILKYKKIHYCVKFNCTSINENINFISNYGDIWTISREDIRKNLAYSDYFYNCNFITNKLNNNIDLFNCRCKKCLFNFFALRCKKCPKCGSLKIEILKQFIRKKIHGKIIDMDIKEWQLCNIKE